VRWLIALALIWALPAAAQSRPELIVNGSFADGLNGWTVKSTNSQPGHVRAATDRDYEPKTHSPAGTFATFNSGDAVPNAVLSQTVATATNTDYLLTFTFGTYDAGGSSNQALEAVVVSNGEILAGKFVGPNGGGRDLSKIFRTYHVPFTAYGPTTTIVFTDRSAHTESVDGLLTQVSVTRR